MDQLPERVNVLLIEDDDSVAQMARKILTGQDQLPYQFIVEVAQSFSSGMRRLEDEVKVSIDLVILDLKLPNGEGTKLIDRFREQHLDIPLVIWTGQEDYRVDSLKKGATRFLFKDGDRRHMLEVIQDALNAGRYFHDQVLPALIEWQKHKKAVREAKSAAKELALMVSNAQGPNQPTAQGRGDAEEVTPEPPPVVRK